MGRVRGKRLSTMMMMMRNGTQRNIPGMPQMAPHSTRLSMMTMGLILNEAPIIRGSRMLPMIICRVPMPATTSIGSTKSLDWARAMVAGNRVATMEPMVGMKLSRKISRPQTPGKSTPRASRKM